MHLQFYCRRADFVGMDDDRDCVEHVWRVVGLVLEEDGAMVEHECGRCGASMLVSPDELGGWAG